MDDEKEARELSKVKQNQVNYKAISNHMRDIRKERKFTQGFIAEQMHVTPNFYSTLETGANKVNLHRLFQFAVITNTPINDLIAGAYPNLPINDGKGKTVNQTRVALDNLLDQCSDEALIGVYDVCSTLIKHLK